MTRISSVSQLLAPMQVTGKPAPSYMTAQPFLTVCSGSGGTEHSGSTAPYDSAASSSRLSVSTNPSSIDVRSDRNVQAQYKDVPVPPAPAARPGFLRNSARTFSLGMGLKSKEPSHPAPADSSDATTLPSLPLESRGRAATASSASTATPPRLFDPDLALDSAELNDFGNMFEGIGTNSRDPSPPLAKRNVS